MVENTHKRAFTIHIPPATLERLKAWVAKQPFPPKQGDVVAKAISEFLDRNEGRK